MLQVNVLDLRRKREAAIDAALIRLRAEEAESGIVISSLSAVGLSIPQVTAPNTAKSLASPNKLQLITVVPCSARQGTTATSIFQFESRST